MKLLSLIGLFFVSSCIGPKENGSDRENTATTMHEELTFLALGDSYTIGESVEEAKRWPVQLTRRLNDTLRKKLQAPQIIARTGWTTDELLKAIDTAEVNPPYDLVSLLIGVNNQYRGYPTGQYRDEFELLLKQAIAFAGNDTSRVFVVSIPDYGVTSFAREKGLDAEKTGEEIDQYNRIAKDIATEYQVTFFDITPISRNAEEQPDLVASDGLHPSGEMYAEWVDLIVPGAMRILDE